MYHAHLIQQGKRKPLLWIVCDMLIALGMGWIMLGLGGWLDISWQTSQSLAIMAGWAGPQLINRMIDASLDRLRNAEVTDEG